MSKIKKNDNVKIITGKDKGKTGKILKVLATENKVVVEGINLATIHKKPTGQTPGQIVKEERPISVSNVAYLEGDKPVKVGYQVIDGKKVRISRKTKNKIG
ncbi:MAG: 50S ribosomal protein L24 [Rickettsiales bacterium]|jgi:large subunit ribosomal protein L24|nr:50S ribosomal protein L24 [Rickettsiales bacterium]